MYIIYNNILFNTLFSNQKTLMTLLTHDTYDSYLKKTWQSLCLSKTFCIFAP